MPNQLVKCLTLLGGMTLAACGQMPGDEVEVVDGNLTSGAIYVLKNVNSGKCVDITGASTNSGANVEQWDCNGHTNQQFKFTDTGSGVYEVRPQNSTGQCVDVYQASLVNGGNIDQWSCNGHTSQRWKLISAGTGKYLLQAVNSGKCMDAAGASLNRGANIQQWTCSTSATNQQFTFSLVSGGSTSGPSASQLLALTTSCNQASSGKYATDSGGSATVPICRLNGAFFWKADMDVDCDGVSTTQCNGSTDPWYQNQTSATTSTGQPMNAALTPYYVIPLPSSRFDYTKNSIALGQVGAVIYNGKVVYGVFADEGPSDIIGEASYAMAQALGINPDPANGGVDSGVTYMVFTGSAGIVSPIEDHNKATSVGISRANWVLSNN